MSIIRFQTLGELTGVVEDKPEYADWIVGWIADIEADLRDRSNFIMVQAHLARRFGEDSYAVVEDVAGTRVILLNPVDWDRGIGEFVVDLLRDVSLNGLLSDDHYGELVETAMRDAWETMDVADRIVMCEWSGCDSLEPVLESDIRKLPSDVLERLEANVRGE